MLGVDEQVDTLFEAERPDRRLLSFGVILDGQVAVDFGAEISVFELPSKVLTFWETPGVVC